MIANCLSASFSGMGGESSDRDFIDRLVAHVGVSASEVATRAGLAVSTLTRPLNHPVKYRLSKATIDKLRQAYPAFGDWAESEPGFDHDRQYVRVNVLPSYGGMGGGGTGDADKETGLISRRLVEDELRAQPSDLLIIDVRGDSMEPDFMHGDQILIDCRDCDPRQPGAFALWDGDGYVIKLIERIPNRAGWYRVFSANGRYTPYEIDAGALWCMSADQMGHIATSKIIEFRMLGDRHIVTGRMSDKFVADLADFVSIVRPIPVGNKGGVSSSPQRSLLTAEAIAQRAASKGGLGISFVMLQRGMLLAAVMPASRANAANLKAGQVITAINGKTLAMLHLTYQNT